MTYDEFSEKLRTIQAEYLKEHGKPIETIEQLVSILDRRLLKPKRKGLRSLKGLF